jgi:hypothetical protein
MKNLKLFLTASTFCLAIAAVAGTQANARVFQTGYTDDIPNSTCTIPSGVDCTGNTVDCKTTGGIQLFAQDTQNPCSAKLKKD